MEFFRQNQRAHFDDNCFPYQSLYGVDSPFHQAMSKRLLAFAQARTGQCVLDVGCGLGRATIPLLAAGCQVVGLDISQTSLDWLQRRVAELQLGDRFSAACTPIEDYDSSMGFDLVLGRGVLHHLAQPGFILAKLRQRLLPSGRIVFMDPNPFNPFWVPFISMHPNLSWSVERYVLRTTPGYTQRLLRSSGFEQVECVYAGMLPPLLWGFLPGVEKIESTLAGLPVLDRLAMYSLVRGTAP
jgi:SAM-dependent methyltransferase